jgi:hypothetical protein
LNSTTALQPKKLITKDKKQTVSDFRYNSAAARGPWAAACEPVREQDVAQLVRFLLKPAVEWVSHRF